MKSGPSTETKDAVVAMYVATGKMGETSRLCGVSIHMMYRILYERGVPRGHGRRLDIARRKKLSAGQETEIATAHAAGALAGDLAKKYGVSDWLIKKTIVAAGLRPHRRGGKYKSFTEEDDLELVRLHGEDLSQCAISAIFGSSQTSVGKRLRALGHKPITGKPSRERHANWKGGVVRSVDGYVMEMVADDDPMRPMARLSRYVMQHRLVMARSLGRCLTKGETVHHINGVRSDNRIENLQLRQGWHGAGVRHVCQDCGSSNVAPALLGLESET